MDTAAFPLGPPSAGALPKPSIASDPLPLSTDSKASPPSQPIVSGEPVAASAAMGGAVGGAAVPETPPVQLLEFKNNKFEFKAEGEALLASLTGSVAVIGIAGRLRSGKSVLLNRFNDSERGFAIGHTTDTCTLGVWLWPMRPHIRQALGIAADHVILADFEGLYNTAPVNERRDTGLFTIALLMSSLMVYNTSSVVDSKAIAELKIVANVVDNLHIDGDAASASAAAAAGQFTGEEKRSPTAVLFPPLLWVLRDFTLDLKPEHTGNPDRYLEDTLRAAQRDRKLSAAGSVEASDAACLLTERFPSRSLELLPWPLESDDMKRLEQTPYMSWKPNFRAAMSKLLTKAAALTTAKRLASGTASHAVNGTGLLAFLRVAVTAFNESRAIVFADAWTNMAQASCAQAQGAALALYKRVLYQSTHIAPEDVKQTSAGSAGANAAAAVASAAAPTAAAAAAHGPAASANAIAEQVTVIESDAMLQHHTRAAAEAIALFERDTPNGPPRPEVQQTLRADMTTHLSLVEAVNTHRSEQMCRDWVNARIAKLTAELKSADTQLTTYAKFEEALCAAQKEYLSLSGRMGPWHQRGGTALLEAKAKLEGLALNHFKADEQTREAVKARKAYETERAAKTAEIDKQKEISAKLESATKEHADAMTRAKTTFDDQMSTMRKEHDDHNRKSMEHMKQLEADKVKQLADMRKEQYEADRAHQQAMEKQQERQQQQMMAQMKAQQEQAAAAATASAQQQQQTMQMMMSMANKPPTVIPSGGGDGCCII